MGKCKQCGKFGIFLPLNENGLCEKCQKQNRAFVEWVASKVTGSNRTSKPNKSDTSSIRYPRKPSSFKAHTGGRISKKDYSGIYDLSGMLEVDNNYYVLSNEANREKATSDIMELNRFIDEAKAICPDMRDIHIYKSEIRFEYNPDDEARTYTIMGFCPKTKSGNLPVCRMEMSFFPCRDLFGKIFYSCEGIHKCEITIWRRTETRDASSVRFGGTCWTIKVAKVKGELKVNSIDRTIDGYKTPVYRASKK